jgi:hypothetical protein
MAEHSPEEVMALTAIDDAYIESVKQAFNLGFVHAMNGRPDLARDVAARQVHLAIEMRKAAIEAVHAEIGLTNPKI